MYIYNIQKCGLIIAQGQFRYLAHSWDTHQTMPIKSSFIAFIIFFVHITSSKKTLSFSLLSLTLTQKTEDVSLLVLLWIGMLQIIIKVNL